MTGAYLLDGSDLSSQAIQHEETRLRAQYLRVDAVSARLEDPQSSTEKLVTASAVFLEFFLLSATAHEILHEQGVGAVTQLPWPASDFARRLRDRSGLDPAMVLRDVRRSLAIPQPATPPTRSLPLSAVVRAARSLLEACPVDALEQMAATRGLETWGHRCRVAFDGLQSLVIRNDPRVEGNLRVLGRAYESGTLSVDEVAKLLDVRPYDAVALLESHGYSRRMDVIRMDPEERAAKLASIRHDRLERNGHVPFSRERVVRDVIASERIEGVDARRWIPRDPA